MPEKTVFPQCFSCEFCREMTDDKYDRPNPSPGKHYSLDKGDLGCHSSVWMEPQPIRYMDYLLIRNVGCHTFCQREDGIILGAV